MNTATVISLSLTSALAAFAFLIIYTHVRELLIWRDQALMAYKHTRMRQELVAYVANHSQEWKLAELNLMTTPRDSTEESQGA